MLEGIDTGTTGEHSSIADMIAGVAEENKKRKEK